MSETTSTPLAADTTPVPDVDVVLNHPTLEGITLTVPQSHLDEALGQGWLEQPPAADALAVVEAETGGDQPPVTEPAATTPPAPPAPAVSTAKSTEKPSGPPRS